ncbi:MAG: ABC transporter permease, partial [Proteobacteria bacterium]|nr:ABC transporter permease [Pseudomonadota bacterium]
TAEVKGGASYTSARATALNAALIPTINSLFAVGLVSLPGMMTGQILSGVDPFIAARYQILVMCMLLTTGGFSSVLFLLAARTIIDPGTDQPSK